jgi:hypothetical protein
MTRLSFSDARGMLARGRDLPRRYARTVNSAGRVKLKVISNPWRMAMP